MGRDAGQKRDASAATVEGVAHAALDLPTAAELQAAARPETKKEARPAAATAGIGLMLIAGAVDVGLGFYWIGYGGNALGGLFFLLIGVAYLFGGRGLFAGESWGWGAGVFAGAFAVLFGALLLPLGSLPIALAVAVFVPLLLVRPYYGMVRYDADAEERRKDDLHAERTRNPEGVPCPHCESTQLWIAADGSAYCEHCKTGTISLRRPA